MATITITSTSADIIGTGSDDTFIYDAVNAGPAGNPAPVDVDIDGRNGTDTLDFVTADEGALLGDTDNMPTSGTVYEGTFDGVSGEATFGDNSLTSIELIKFENGTLDLSDPAAIAGQTFVSVGTYQTLTPSVSTTITFDDVEHVYVTEETAPDTFGMGTLDDGTDDGWVYTAVEGEAISTGGVQTAQGTFTVNGDGELVFVAKQSYLDSLVGTEGETFTVEVTLAEDAGSATTVTKTYTITVEAPDAGPTPAFEFTEGDDTYTGFDVTDTDNVVPNLYDATNTVVIGADGLGGNDFISGSNGRDIIFGNDGDDRIFAGAGSTPAVGVSVDDLFAGGDGNDEIGGGAGADVLIGDSVLFDDVDSDFSDIAAGNVATDDGDDLLYGGEGNDFIVTGSFSGENPFEDGAGTELDPATQLSAIQANFLAGISGNGADEAWGGAGDDSLFGDNGDDLLAGGEGNDDIFGGAGDDVVYGGAGDGTDYVEGGAGADEIYGGGGEDFLHGDGGTDVIYGGDGNDYIYGEAGADDLYGGKGSDHISGGTGNDSLTGGEADGVTDYLNGGSGADTFVMNVGDGADIVTDFTQGQGDLIDLTAFGIDFATVDANAYQVGTGVTAVTTIELDANTSISLDGVELADLSASDFIF